MLLADALRVGDEAPLVIFPANPRAAVADRAQGFSESLRASARLPYPAAKSARSETALI
jgi:hypothetical protein